MPASSGSSNPR